ncbi:uncharacterized protein LOC127835495 [Dreissena polymorpha]|uniref:uncharacterized protein LOC127835495 n=1 Tax=Dreissena polymorpha TaxID=45954 RepID=UPI0022646EE2|nr:uncharacterized protein LOC127835495 [Dreissena polymorpha]
MATSSPSSVELGSDEVKDYICNACEDQNNVETRADFFCKQCERFYCGNCIDSHGKALAKHTTFGRVEIDKWPVSKKVVDFLQTCDVHKDHKIDQFCNLHKHLCCPQCVSDQHSQCREVTQISELTNSQPSGLEGLSVELETVLGEIKTLQISQEASIQSLQRTYNEHREVMIEQMCGNLNTYIDKCDNNSVGTSGGNEQYLNEEMCRNVVSILNEFDNITAKELNEMKDEVISIKGSVTSSIHKCTSLHNDLSQFHEIVQKIGDHKELCLIASIKCKHIIQQALTLLGKSGKAFNVQSNAKHNVRISSDSYPCSIIGICVLTDGQVLVADRDNKRVKLLSQQYKVVSHWDVNAEPQDICQITPRDRLYITSYWNKLHTLARDGTLLATCTDPALEGLYGLHVTPAGQVLVCGAWSNTVLQVGWEGESKLATLATREDGVWYPESLLLSKEDNCLVKGWPYYSLVMSGDTAFPWLGIAF